MPCYHSDTRQWRYRFYPHGQPPPEAVLISEKLIRLTERVSGPALAARLLVRLGESGLLQAIEGDDGWDGRHAPFSALAALYHDLAYCRGDHDLVKAAQLMRQAELPVSSALLRWADGAYSLDRASPITMLIHDFATEIAAELAEALRIWLESPGWNQFGRRIVLSGGVGIGFLAASEQNGGKSFCRRLAEGLRNCQIERSCLPDATERESYIFLHPC